MEKTMKKLAFKAIILAILCHISLAHAGNIHPTEKFAWSETTGWINFSPIETHYAQFQGTFLTGYVWAENIGWIKLAAHDKGPFENSDASNWGVNIHADNTLSGFAWSENTGWISFASANHQVTFDPISGAFQGFAWGENVGYIHLHHADNDYGVSTPRLSIENKTTAEHFGKMIFEVRLYEPINQDVFVDYITVDQTAIVTADYLTATGTLIFEPGAVQKEIQVSLLDDDQSENTETFQLMLKNPVNASLVVSSAVGFIVDNETQSIITASSNDGGTITPSGEIPVINGQSQAFSFDPIDEYHLENLFINGAALQNLPENTYSFYNIQKDQSINAEFAINQYQIRITRESDGSVFYKGDSIPSEHTFNANAKTSHTFYFYPGANYHVGNVLVDGQAIGPVTEYTIERITKTKTIHVIFEINRYNIQGYSDANGKMVPQQAMVDHGQNQTFVMEPLMDNYQVADVIVDGQSMGPLHYFTFEFVSEPHSISVTFEKIYYNIQVVEGRGGNVSPNENVQVEINTDQSFLFQANRATYSDYCDIGDILVDGQSIGATEHYTFRNVVENHHLEAQFYCTLYVCPRGCLYRSIQDAIEGSVDGDIIMVHPGTYYEPLDLMGKAVQIKALPGETQPIINAQERRSAITINQKETTRTVISGFIIEKGTASYGGGLLIDGSSPLIENCMIRDNSAYLMGGGVYVTNGAAPVFENVKIIENTCDGIGAGILIDTNAEPQMHNVVIADNQAPGRGPGMYVREASASIYNATFHRNLPLDESALVAEENAWVLLQNSIVWTTETSNQTNAINVINSHVNISYSDIQQTLGVFPGIGNMNLPPIFSDAYHLSPTSPCIDWGTSNNAPEMDIDNQPRNTPDIGADEYFPSRPIANFYPTSFEEYPTFQATFVDASVSSFTITRWDWDFGDNTQVIDKTGMDQNHSYQEPGWYTVRLTVTDSLGNQSTRTWPDLILVKPKDTAFELTADRTEAYYPAIIQFSPHVPENIEIQHWEWDFGDGGVSTSEMPEHTYTRTGTYSVSLKVIKSDGTYDSRTRYQYIKILSRKPLASFWASPVTGTAPLSVQFYDTSTALDDISQHLWSFGDSHGSTDAQPVHSYAEPGHYTVALTVYSGNESDTRTIPDYIYVKAAGTPLTVCSLESCAYTSIQSAIDAAVKDDIILVQSGHYYENIDFKGKALTVRSVSGDPESTIINGDNNGPVVRLINGEQPDSILDGFTIQNGFNDTGAGILIQASPDGTVSRPTIKNCIISNNTATDSGGGLGIDYAEPYILDCKIIKNQAPLGAGISMTSFSAPDLRDLYIYKNISAESGGGIFIHSSSPLMNLLEINENKASYRGGGIYVLDAFPGKMTNLIITRNQAQMGGGMYLKNASSAFVTFCTIADNDASLAGDGLYLTHSGILINSTILWHAGDEFFLDDRNDVRINFSNIGLENNEIYPGTGNINNNPKFVSPGSDYHLNVTSPCKNKADKRMAPIIDFDKDSRPIGNGFDIGADEAQNAAPQVNNLIINTDEDLASTILLQAIDEEADQLKFSIISHPEHGILSENFPNVIYTPNKDFNGPDSFTYKANDGFLDSQIATVTIEIQPVNDPPAFTAGMNLNVKEDSGVFYQTQWATGIRSGPGNESQDVFFYLSVSHPILFSQLPEITADGDLSFQPADNANGSAEITVRLKDTGGTERNGEDTSESHILTIQILSVNDRPSFVMGPDQIVLEDSGLTYINAWAKHIKMGPSDEIQQQGTFYLSHSHPNLFDTGPIISANGDLSFTPAPNAFGDVDINVLLKDNGGTEIGGIDGSYTPAVFTIQIIPVNDSPSFIKGDNVQVEEDSGERTISKWATDIMPGPANEYQQQIEFFVDCDQPSLFAQKPSVSAAGTLHFEPAPNISGMVLAWLYIKDNGGRENDGVDQSASQNFTIRISDANDPPYFTAGESIEVTEDSGQHVFENWITDISPGADDEGAQTLTFLVTNDAPQLFTIPPAIAPNGTLTFRLEPNASGNATLNIQLRDSGDKNNTSEIIQRYLTIIPINDAPSFVKGENISIMEDAGLQYYTNWATEILPGPPSESSQNIMFNLHVISQENLSFSRPPAISSDGHLTFEAYANSNGKAIVEVRVQDNGGTANNGVDTSITQNFEIEVVAINDPPEFVLGPDQVVFEDKPTDDVQFWATDIRPGPVDESNQNLKFIVTTEAADLFLRMPTISPEGTLSYLVKEGVYGSSQIHVQLWDSGGIDGGGNNLSDTQTFTIWIRSVNNAPTFTAGLDQVTPEDSSMQIVYSWATDISPGPENESNQTVSFNVSADNTSIFAKQPALSVEGNLTYEPLPDAFGVSHVDVMLQDDGGTLYGGNNTSDVKQFTITILPVNDAPDFSKGEDILIVEDTEIDAFHSWATNIYRGPNNESDQGLTFEVFTNNRSLFEDPPRVEDTGSLLFRLNPNANGSAACTIRLRDSGGTDNNGVNTSGVRYFNITVTSVNDAPTFTLGNNVLVFEDTDFQVIPSWAGLISAGPPDEANQIIEFHVIAARESLFETLPSVSSNGRLTFQPAKDMFGDTSVTIYLEDDGPKTNGGTNVSDFKSFTISILPVNDAPSFMPGSNVTVNEDPGPVSIPNWATEIDTGAFNEVQDIHFDISTSNTYLFPDAPVITSDGELCFTPAVDQFGDAAISVYIKDSGGSDNDGVDQGILQMFQITVRSVNDRPTFEMPSELIVAENSGLNTFINWATQIRPGPRNENVQTINFLVSVSNNDLFASLPVISNYGALNFTPKENISGDCTVDVTLKDTGGREYGGEDISLVKQFRLSITQVNNRPIFDIGENQRIQEDSPPQVIYNWATNIRSGPDDEADQKIWFTVQTNNESLFQGPVIIKSDGTLCYTPAANAWGSSGLTVLLHDDGDGENVSFPQYGRIEMIPVNDAPTFNIPKNVYVNEDAGQQRIFGWASDISPGPNESDQYVTCNVAIENPNVYPPVDLSVMFEELPELTSDGTLTFIPRANAFGEVPISVQIQDNGIDGMAVAKSAPQYCTIHIQSVNDRPVFVPGNHQEVAEDCGPQVINNWAYGIHAGADNESTQEIEFQLSTNNTAIFDGLPRLTLSGVLSYTPAANAYGSATVYISLVDNGGTANNGVDRSDQYPLIIRILSVNDAPSFAVTAPEYNLMEDANAQSVFGWIEDISAGPANESGQFLSFHVTTTRPYMFEEQPAISEQGHLYFKPAQDAAGSAQINVYLQDSGGKENGGLDSSVDVQAFKINILPVNDPPSFVMDGWLSVIENAGPQTQLNWAQNIHPGDSNEAGQTLHFETQTNHPELFQQLPYISSNGTLTFTPAPDIQGTSTVTVTLYDNGGTANGGKDQSEAKNFVIAVAAVNQAPTFTKGPDQVILEDAGKQSIKWASNISPGPENESGQTLQFVVTVNDPQLFTALPSISNSGVLVYTPKPDVSGTTQAKVVLEDNGGVLHGGDNTSAIQTFQIKILPVNDRPRFEISDDPVVLENSDRKVLENWAYGITRGATDESGQNLTFHISINNSSLFNEQPKISETGCLTFRPQRDQNGNALVTVSLKDDGGTAFDGEDTSESKVFTISVLGYNNSPTFKKGDNIIVREDSGLSVIANWATDILPGPPDEWHQHVSFVVHTANARLFTMTPSITSSGTLSFSPTPDAFGTAIITVALQDDGPDLYGASNLSDPQMFSITVLPVNDSPSFTPGSDIQVVQDSGLFRNVNWAKDITAGPINEGEQTVSFIAQTNNEALFSEKPNLSPTGTLGFLPKPDQSGSATVLIRLKDSGGTDNNGLDMSDEYALRITVSDINNAPEFTLGPDIIIYEDMGIQSFPNWAYDIMPEPGVSSDQSLRFYLTWSHTDLFKVGPTISFDGKLAFTPSDDEYGVSTVEVYAKDDGGTENGGTDTSMTKTFTINILPVNDAPSFIKGMDQTIDEDSGPQRIANWATQISSGPENESNQNVSFYLSARNPELFFEQPVIDTSGKLYYTPKPDAYGDSLIDVYIKDNGRRDNDGLDTSETQRFTISILPINDQPENSSATQFVRGDVRPGNQVTAVTDTWNDLRDNNHSDLSFMYQWQRQKADQIENIPNATGKSYLVQMADVGTYLRIYLKVSDNGIGIPVNKTTIAMSPFMQVYKYEGDFNFDMHLGLEDIITGLKVMSGIFIDSNTPLIQADLNGDGQIDMVEIIYVMDIVGQN
jgi:PKD repeat protein